MLVAGLIISRFLHFAAATALFGASLYPLYTYYVRAEPQPAQLSRWLPSTLAVAAFAALLSNLLWLAFVTANMNDALSAAVDPVALVSVIHDTGFGRLWIVRLALNALVVVFAVAQLFFAKGRQQTLLLPLLTAALLASLAGTGHTQTEEHMGRYVHTASDAAHLLAAGAWLGGLLALAFTLKQTSTDAEAVLRRFSGIGYVAVAVLVGSGLVNSWFLVGSVSGLFNTPYGQLLLIKLLLVAGMLGFAALNRFWLVPSLTRNSERHDLALVQLRRHVMGEQALGLIVLVIVSMIGTIQPATGP